eukprot:GILK01010536.1.p1 GENE.GILK01010536.1~~GILK01010536.1.p1  ORF type:complete len:955 (-),score=192.01 GILK01010536.1:322-2853(-)
MKTANHNLREAIRLSTLKHESIVAYRDCFLTELPEPFTGKQTLHVCTLMELCEDGDLLATLRCIRNENRRMEETELIRYMCQTLAGLAYLHASKTLHRDIKPHNLLFANNKALKLADLGEAVMDTGAVTGLAGTYAYMSPEMLRGNSYSWQTDIWSLGCVLLDITTLVFAFERDQSMGVRSSLATCPEPQFRRVLGSVVNSKEWSEKIKSLLKQMLNRNPVERPSAATLLDGLTVASVESDTLSARSSSFEFPLEEEMMCMIEVEAAAPKAVKTNRNRGKTKRKSKMEQLSQTTRICYRLTTAVDMSNSAHFHGFIVMYSLTDVASFETAVDLLQTACNMFASHDALSPPVILIGNKSDLTTEQAAVSPARVESICEPLHVKHFLTSASTCTNVIESVDYLCSLLFANDRAGWDGVNLALVGAPGVGKATFRYTLTGESDNCNYDPTVELPQATVSQSAVAKQQFKRSSVSELVKLLVEAESSSELSLLIEVLGECFMIDEKTQTVKALCKNMTAISRLVEGIESPGIEICVSTLTECLRTNSKIRSYCINQQVVSKIGSYINSDEAMLNRDNLLSICCDFLSVLVGSDSTTASSILQSDLWATLVFELPQRSCTVISAVCGLICTLSESIPRIKSELHSSWVMTSLVSALQVSARSADAWACLNCLNAMDYGSANLSSAGALAELIRVRKMFADHSAIVSSSQKLIQVVTLAKSSTLLPLVDAVQSSDIIDTSFSDALGNFMAIAEANDIGDRCNDLQRSSQWLTVHLFGNAGKQTSFADQRGVEVLVILLAAESTPYSVLPELIQLLETCLDGNDDNRGRFNVLNGPAALVSAVKRLRSDR